MFRERNDIHDNQTMESVIDEDMTQTGSTFINLTQLGNGKAAKVIELHGGHQFIAKLETMGILPETIIVKKSTTLMKGPIVIEKGEMQLAIGYEMAQKIMVEPFEQG
jgi:Fe2+ transport system protein FeoA